MVARITIVGNKNLFCGITSGCCSNLARNQKVVASCEELLQKVALLLAKKSVHVYLAHFTGPVYGVTQSNYSRLSLNGQLYKTDTSVKRTLRVGPCLSLLLLFDSL